MDYSKLNLEELFQKFKNDKLKLIDFLKFLPNDTERDFELYLTRLIVDKPLLRSELESILQKSSKLEDDIVYPSFYALCIFYRRMKDTTKLYNIINTYEARFKFKPMYNQILSQYLKTKGSSDDILMAIQKAKIATQQVKNNAGVFHNYAECIATAFEENLNIESKYINEGIDNIDKAISLDPYYAKYYCTYGRILALQGKFKEAKQMIRKAIDIEDSQKSDYPIRISDYQDYLSRVTFADYKNKMADKIDSYIQQVEETKNEVKRMTEKAMTRNLEFLGFFAALVSFTIASIQILSKQTFTDSVQLILMLCGGLLCAFSGFGIIIHGKSYLLRAIIVFSLGILLILLVLSVLPKFLY